MRLVSLLSCVLTAQAYLLSPLPPHGLTLIPVPVLRSWRLQTPEPLPEPVVISLDNFDCPAVGVFADEESGCEQYWVCNEEVRSTKKAFHYTCNPGQLFDASIGACNEASAVDDYCNINVPPKPAKNAPQVEPVVIDFVDFECPEVGIFPDEESGCEQYYVCNEALKSFRYTCNPGQLFDAELGACNDESAVDDYCNANKQRLVISLDDFDCPAVGVFADQESGCEQYWVCNEEVRSTKKAFHYTCNPGQLFDASIGACNEASAADDYCNIHAKNAPQPEPVIIDFADFECPEVGIFPDQESGCEKYYVCNEEWSKASPALRQYRPVKGFHYTCNPGQLFDAELGACNEESAVDDYCNANKHKRPEAPETAPIVLELPEDSVSFQCPGDGAYAHQESGCTKYFVCNGGRFWIHNCNPGLLFDAKIGQCNWPEQVDGYCNAGPDQRFFSGSSLQRFHVDAP